MGTPRNFTNNASGASLNGALSAGATTALLNNYSNFPAVPFTATIARNQTDEEIVLVTAVAGSTVTITRGYDGTSGQAHSAGASFEHTAIAKDFRDASAHVESTGAVHGLSGSIVGDTDTQTLTNKTVKLLKGLANGTGAAFEADNDSGATGKLFRGLQAGVEKFFVDFAGALTAQAITGTTGTFSGALSAAGTTLASLTVTGGATVTGLLTANGGITSAGLAALNGGATVPTGKKVTLTDAPVVGADAANKTYVDAGDTAARSYADTTAGTSAATNSALVRRDAAGRSQFADPSAAQDAATKNYVDGRSVAPVTPTLAAQFTNYDAGPTEFQPLRIWSEGKTAFASGFIKVATALTQQDYTICDIPAGLTPTQQNRVSGVALTNASVNSMRVDAFSATAATTPGKLRLSVIGNMAVGLVITVNMHWPLV